MLVFKEALLSLAKLLEYVRPIIRVSIVLLCHWYAPKIQFYLMIFS